MSGVKRKRTSEPSSKTDTQSSSSNSKPTKLKRARRHYNLPSAKSDVVTVVSELMQQEFRRRASFEDKMVELTSQKLEEARATRREIASFVQEYRRRSAL